MRYTGWTVPTYNQSQQQYGYDQNAYNMGPQGQGGQYAYQGQPQGEPLGGPNAGPVNNGPAYYDATQTANQGNTSNVSLICGTDCIGYQPPTYPPPAGRRK